MMHSSSFDTVEIAGKDGGEVLVAIAALVTEVRVPGGKLCASSAVCKTKGFYEGPHCPLNKAASDHRCDLTDILCSTFGHVREQVLDLHKRRLPVCLEVLLGCSCRHQHPDDFLLEKWCFSVNHRRSAEPLYFNFVQLLHAIRSQLYFSQLTAWLALQEDKPRGHPLRITQRNLRYRLRLPGETFEPAKFALAAVKHEFPLTDIGSGCTATVSFLSLPRMSTMPGFVCQKCTSSMMQTMQCKLKSKNLLVDDRMHTSCTLKGKHRCEDFEDAENGSNAVVIHRKSNKLTTTMTTTFKRLCQNENGLIAPSTSKPRLTVDVHKANSFQVCGRNLLNSHKNDLNSAVQVDKGKILLDAIERTGYRSTIGIDKERMEDGEEPDKCVQNSVCAPPQPPSPPPPNESSDNGICDKIMSESDISSIKSSKGKYDVYYSLESTCDSLIPSLQRNRIGGAKKQLTFDTSNAENGSNSSEIPTPFEQAKFRKDLDHAANMVFHSRTGLPLTSSPAPVRRGKSCFDFDSSINSVSAIKSALFSTSFSTDDESESDGSIVSPCSPETCALPQRQLSPVKYRRKGHAANLLGSFEESVLNGRLEPVSTVHGFSAELGASGSFVPKHLVVPVTVFFYTLGDNDKVSSPYLSHINLGKKGYNVPKSGTIQVTLFNPLGTVVKMFVIMYDLSDMPANSQTFIRQRTFYMPTNLNDQSAEWGPKWLRYLIHLRFISSKSGKIYLHSDIRMIIFRKSDMDTATAHGIDVSYELRSFTHMPINPRFSPRK